MAAYKHIVPKNGRETFAVVLHGPLVVESAWKILFFERPFEATNPLGSAATAARRANQCMGSSLRGALAPKQSRIVRVVLDCFGAVRLAMTEDANSTA